MLTVLKPFSLNNVGRFGAFPYAWLPPALRGPPAPSASPVTKERARSVQNANNDVTIVKEMKSSVGIQETNPKLKIFWLNASTKESLQTSE